MVEPFNWMESPAARTAAKPLDTQSRGRELSDKERIFADALEEIFKSGTHDMDEVARKLGDAKIISPHDNGIEWTSSSLLDVLETINASLDEAHQENGYGA